MEELLEESRNFLSEFKLYNHSEIKNWSIVEPHLTGKYLNQMIELNKYMFTEASTNYPYNKYLEPLYVSGLISTAILNPKCIKQLESIGLSFYYINYYENPNGKVHMHYTEDGQIRDFIAKCKPCKWGESMTPKNLEVFFETIIQNKVDNPELADLMRFIHQRLNETDDNVDKVYNELTENQINFIKRYTWKSLANRQYTERLTDIIRHTFQPSFRHGLMDRNLYHVNKVKEEIRKGNIVYFKITNYHDPFNRDLYAFLIQQFSNHRPKEINQERLKYILNLIKTKY